MPRAVLILVLFVAAAVCAPAAGAQLIPEPVQVVVTGPGEQPSADQVARYGVLRERTIATFGEEAAGPTALAPGVTSGQLNIAIAAYRARLDELRPLEPLTAAIRRRHVPASERVKDRYTNLYRRALKRFGRPVVGYNLRHGLRRCFPVKGSHRKECHRRQPYLDEVGRRIARLRHLLNRPIPGRFPRPGWSTAVAHNMARIRACESGGFYGAVGQGGGPYGHYGAWQFGLPTWQSVGGSGLPSQASPAEQDFRAWLLWQRRGYQPWECASILGIR